MPVQDAVHEVADEASSLEETPPAPPLCLRDVREQLLQPFYTKDVYVRPGTVSKKKPWARALFYIKSQAIEDRLDEVAGPENWIAHYEPWGTTRLLGQLTILGVTKESTGEGGDDDDDNCGTIAEAQVFKRLFSKFGFRMFYRLPEKWGRYDKEEKQLVNPARDIIQLYLELGLKNYISPETKDQAKQREQELRAAAKQEAEGASNGSRGNGTPNAPEFATAEQIGQLRTRGWEAQILQNYQLSSLEQLPFQKAVQILSRKQKSRDTNNS